MSWFSCAYNHPTPGCHREIPSGKPNNTFSRPGNRSQDSTPGSSGYDRESNGAVQFGAVYYLSSKSFSRELSALFSFYEVIGVPILSK